MKVGSTLFKLLIVLLISIPGVLQAQQCRHFAKKNCKVFWEDFKSTGQAITAEMASGETADLTMVFHRAHDYRVIVCAEENLGDVEFKIVTTTGEVLFDNKDHDMSVEWDFSMTSTKRLIMEVTTEGGGGEDDLLESGCVALMVGVKATPRKGFH